MANDVSYFKIPGDNTQYSFNDADAETDVDTLNDKFTGTDIGASDAVFRATGSIVVNTAFSVFEYVDLYFSSQGKALPCIRIYPNYSEQTYALNFGYFNSNDNGIRMFSGEFHTAGRYVDTYKMYMSNTATGGSVVALWTDISNSDLLYIRRIIGYNAS